MCNTHKINKHIQPKFIHLIFDIRYCYLIHLMETFSSLLSSWCFSLSLLSELIVLFVHHHHMKMYINAIDENIAHYYYCGAKPCQIGRLHRLLFFSSVHNFVVSTSLSITSSLSIPFYEWKMLLPVLRSSFLFGNILFVSLHKESRWDSLLKRPNCPLSRIRKNWKTIPLFYRQPFFKRFSNFPFISHFS